ncbi:SprT-like domain-containing protein [Thioalkalivibrio sp.]|uniref:SprT family zinc-dependent metalloprotease n=1 Tax=Thioalkalivibrio sp. TaxID=2093813 RepID=UPI0039757F87
MAGRCAALDASQGRAIREAAAAFYSRTAHLPIPEIRLDLRGRAAGQWRVKDGVETLRFNPEAFIRDWHAHFPATVAHEVAHSIVYRRFGLKAVPPHGSEWRKVMAELGFPPLVTHRTPLSGRRSRVYIYKCECRSHRLGPRRHHLIRQRGYQYACRDCGGRLEFQERVEWHDQHS